ncbi:hypothetical protein V6N11_037831 [Hibiscus sabdariffa]|uniref:Uncharacterized protein n=2 Tax=Hibiscus sabdariffa TaxID=183260 RepID=A0ABR2FC61_9ROSI
MFGGAWVVDRRIRVNLARYRSRSNYWRRKHSHGIPQEKAHQNDNKFDNVPATGKTGEGGYPKEADVESSSKLLGMSLDEKPVDEAKTHKEALRRIHGHKPDRKSSSKTSANSSESSTTSKNKEKSGSSGDNPIGTDEAINAVCLGKSSHDYANSADKGASRSLGVPELVVGIFEALSGDNISARGVQKRPVGEKGAISSKNFCVDCSLNVPGPKRDISLTQANPIAIGVSGSNNIIRTSNGLVVVQDQADSALDMRVVRASPMGFGSWAESVDLVNNALFLSQKREGSSSSQSEVEKEDLAEDFIPEDFNLVHRLKKKG